MGKIYLDYAATTPTHPEVLKEMLLFFMELIMSKAEEQVQRKICLLYTSPSPRD